MPPPSHGRVERPLKCLPLKHLPVKHSSGDDTVRRYPFFQACFATLPWLYDEYAEWAPVNSMFADQELALREIKSASGEH